jgi:hypothetical protein
MSLGICPVTPSGASRSTLYSIGVASHASSGNVGPLNAMDCEAIYDSQVFARHINQVGTSKIGASPMIEKPKRS